MDPESWSTLNERRREVRDRWPTIWRLPRIARSTRYAAARIRAGQRVLDVGASDGAFGRGLAAGVVYETLDVDPAVQADHRALADVPAGAFDVVTCFEMIEHVGFEEGLDTFLGIRRALKPGGMLFMSTPNIHHPWSYLRSATHKTPWCYDELGGALLAAGFALDGLFRCHHDSLVKGVLRRVSYPLYRIAGVDYAKSLLVVAHVANGERSREN